MDETQLELIADLLDAGINREEVRWDVQKLNYDNIHVLSKIANIWKHQLVYERRPDCICALGRSALAIGVLLANTLSMPLVRFTNSSIRTLGPRYLSLSGQSVVMVDTHVVIGSVLTRYAMLLENKSAHVLTSHVLIDCDIFREVDLSDQVGEVSGFMKLSWLLDEGRKVLPIQDVALREILNSTAIETKEFWKPHQ